MDYDEALKRLGLQHLKGDPRAILKAASEIMMRNPDYHPHNDGCKTVESAPKGLLSAVVGYNEEGEPLFKVHLTPEQRRVTEDLLAVLKAAEAKEPEDRE